MANTFLAAQGYEMGASLFEPDRVELAKEILDVEIQTGQHSSIEDARVAMLLFRSSISVGASFTFVTVIVNAFSVNSPPASVLRTRML